MADRIRLKRSDVPDLIPHETELLVGELALNYADMVLYSLDADGNVKPVTSSGDGAAYSFWVKQGTQGQTVFNGTDDNGRIFGVNLEGFDVTLNGVQLDPNADYILDADNLTLANPLLRDGDTVVIRCLVAGKGNLGFYNITTQDVGTVGANPFGRWTSTSNLTLDNQYDVNWSIKSILDFMQEQIDVINDGMSQGWLCLTKVIVQDRGAGVTNVEAFFESSSPSTTDGYVEFDINGTGDWKKYDQLTPQEQSDLKLFGGVGSAHVMFWAADSLASVPNVLVRHNFFVENEPTLVVEGPAVSPHTFLNLYPDECVGGGMDLPYATHDYVDSGDADLQAQIDALSAAGGYNDAWIQPAIDAGDNTTLTSANAYADTLFSNITHPAPPNLTPYATIAYSDAGDNTTLNSSKSYTDAAIGNITHPAPPDVTGFVKKTGGDSMEGPLFITTQPGNTDSRADRRVITFGVFSNSDASALRLGTTRDRIYVGHNDTAFNGPIKVNEIEEKDAGRGTSFANLIRADDDILHTPTDVSFTDLIDQTEQNKQDIVSLSQLYSDVSHTKMAGRYRHMSTPAPRDGELTIQDGSYTNSGTTVVHMHRKDLNGIVNTGADIDPGDVLEILNVADEGFGVFEVISSSTSGDVINVTVAHVRGYRVPVVGSECRIRLINIADVEVGIDDLDDRYLQVAGDTATGPMVFDGTVETKKMVKVQRPTASGTAGDGFTLYGRVPGNTNVGQKILQLYHNSDNSGDALNYYGKESASTNIMTRSGINSLITGKGYATESYVDDAVNGLSVPDVKDASNSQKGIAKLGQVQRGSGPGSSGLATGCLYYDYTNKVLYIG